MGPPPGSRAIWGGDSILFSLSDESNMAIYDLFFFLAMTHFLEAQVFLSSASFQVLSDQELHVKQVDSLEQEEHFMHLS